MFHKLNGNKIFHGYWNNSDDTLAGFSCLFLVLVNWYQKLVSLSYFSDARSFWCQKPSLDRACSISPTTFVHVAFSFGFFQQPDCLNSGYNMVILKTLKIRIDLSFFLPVSFAGLSVSRFLAPDD